jgi:exosortase
MTAKAAQPSIGRVLGLFTPEGAVMAGVLALAFIGLFYRWFYTQHLTSASKIEDWGHAYVVPIISGYLLWQRRAEIRATSPSIFWPGLAPMVLGIMCYFFFVASRFTGGHMIQGWAVILTLFGLCLLLLGPALMRLIFLPIVFLVFGITISEIVMIKLTFPMQLIASQGAYLVLSVIGVVAGFSADVSGNMLWVIPPSGAALPLNVAEACSGMRMLVAFYALSGAAGILGCKLWWQRVALLLMAAPVAILVNIGRVAVLGLFSLWNQNLASGQSHTLIGTLLLFPGLMLFLFVVWALNKAVREEPEGPGK